MGWPRAADSRGLQRSRARRALRYLAFWFGYLLYLTGVVVILVWFGVVVYGIVISVTGRN